MSRSFFVYGENMLVYHKLPMGHAVIAGKPVYGKYYCRGKFGPTSIPKSEYLKNRDVLEEFEITSEWLNRKYGVEFPTLAFRPSNFWHLDFNTVIELARLIGIKYIKKRGGKYNDIEKRALRKSILSRIEGEDDFD